MARPELDNLVQIGRLKAEPPAESEIAGLIRSGLVRLIDAEREELSLESRFDLAYNAAHALALAALRKLGYRSESRYLVFSSVSSTLWICPESSGAYSTRRIANATWPNTMVMWI